MQVSSVTVCTRFFWQPYRNLSFSLHVHSDIACTFSEGKTNDQHLYKFWFFVSFLRYIYPILSAEKRLIILRSQPTRIQAVAQQQGRFLHVHHRFHPEFDDSRQFINFWKITIKSVKVIYIFMLDNPEDVRAELKAIRPEYAFDEYIVEGMNALVRVFNE